jgi:peptidoglycan/xylan/chitin deacetylase (PgdA/CDA1 family)
MVTTSWDDGHQLDTKLALVLDELGFAGTFYVSPQSAEIPAEKRISGATLRDLAGRFEIGSHTLTHPHLTRLSLKNAASEIRLGNEALQDVLGQPVTSFCYPYGAYRAQHVELVRTAGFLVARTIRRFRTGAAADPLQMGTTTHAARYLADGWPVARRSRTARQACAMWGNWDVLARKLFQETRAGGGVYHLWGHSWEIQKNDDWSRLRSLLRYIADHDVTFVTNGELAERSRACGDQPPGMR